MQPHCVRSLCAAALRQEPSCSHTTTGTIVTSTCMHVCPHPAQAMLGTLRDEQERVSWQPFEPLIGSASPSSGRTLTHGCQITLSFASCKHGQASLTAQLD